MYLEISGASTRTTLDGVKSYHLRHGFRKPATEYIPAQSVGSLCADGEPITNIGGQVFNGFEGGLIQTDADFTAFVGVNLYGNGADTWTKVDEAVWDNHINGSDGTWVQRKDTNGVITVNKVYSLPVTKTLSLAEYNKLVRWATWFTPEGGNGVVPPPA